MYLPTNTSSFINVILIGVQGQTFRGDKSGKLPTSAENSKVLNDLKMLRDG